MKTAVGDPYYGVFLLQSSLEHFGSENIYENLHLQNCAQSSADCRCLLSKMNTAAFLHFSLLLLFGLTDMVLETHQN